MSSLAKKNGSLAHPTLPTKIVATTGEIEAPTDRATPRDARRCGSLVGPHRHRGRLAVGTSICEMLNRASSTPTPQYMSGISGTRMSNRFDGRCG